MNESLHPYVVFLPSDEKTRILNAIFGSKAAVDILRFSLNQGLSSRIYQKDLVSRLSYSNKTIIENLKTMTKLGILKEEMEKNTKTGRIVWVKVYQLLDAGRWFALLLAEEKDLSTKETAEILQNLFRAYIRWVKNLSKKLQISNKELEKIFMTEMKADDQD